MLFTTRIHTENKKGVVTITNKNEQTSKQTKHLDTANNNINSKLIRSDVLGKYARHVPKILYCYAS